MPPCLVGKCIYNGRTGLIMSWGICDGFSFMKMIAKRGWYWVYEVALTTLAKCLRTHLVTLDLAPHIWHTICIKLIWTFCMWSIIDRTELWDNVDCTKAKNYVKAARKEFKMHKIPKRQKYKNVKRKNDKNTKWQRQQSI